MQKLRLPTFTQNRHGRHGTLNRRQFIAAVTALGMGAGVAGVAAQNGGLPDWSNRLPSDMQAGPLGLNSGVTSVEQGEGQVPVSITIPEANIDNAQIEENHIENGVMLDPSGAFVVSWYQETGLIGAQDNSVMSGHVDYWDVGPAIFWEVVNLNQGSQIMVAGADGATYTYEVEWIERVDVASLTQEQLTNMVGPTDYAALTLITCGGDFDQATGEYLERDIIRAELVDSTAAMAAEADPAQPDADTETEAVTGGGSATVDEEGVNLRAEPTTDGEIVTELSQGQLVTITDSPVEADGYIWWSVQTEDGQSGWVANEFLTQVGAGD